MSRDPQAPLTDPRPGDVVQIRAGSRRTVMAIDGEFVVMSSTSPGFPSPCEWRQSIADWRDQVRYAKVVNVAQ